MTRLRRPTLKDGDLKVYWGREPGENPEVMFAWQGSASMRADMKLLHYFIATQHPDPHVRPIFTKMNPSLLEQLDARGYDLTTLKISIKKKVTK